MSNILNINKNEGIKFSKFTGDNNKIHINEVTGNNSIYGEVYIIESYKDEVWLKDLYNGCLIMPNVIIAHGIVSKGRKVIINVVNTIE